MFFWYAYPKKLRLFQAKQSITSDTGEILNLEGKRTVDQTLSAFHSAGGIGKGDEG